MKKLFTLVCGLLFLWLNLAAQVQRTLPENIIDVYTDASHPRPSVAQYTMPYKYQENRYLLFIFTGEFNKDQDYPTAITYNGKSATLLGLSAGSSAEATDAKTSVAIFGMNDATMGAETAKDGTYNVGITWNFAGSVSNNQSYVLSVVSYRYVNQNDPGDFCINGSIGNDASVLTCSPITAGVGDLLWHAAQFARAIGVSMAQPPITTNSFMDLGMNKLLPTGNAANKAYVATVWDRQVTAADALADGDAYPDSLTYTPTFTNTSGENPGRWVVVSIRANYAPIYQHYDGLVWIDIDGDKNMESATEYVPNAGDYVFVAVASNGPDAGKVKALSILDGDGHFQFKLLANQVEVSGLFVDPTYTLAIVKFSSAPPEGGTYPTTPSNAMGIAPTSNTEYYVTTTGAAYVMGPNGVATNVTVSVPVSDKHYEIGIQSPPFSTNVNGGSGFKKGQGYIQMTSMGAGTLLGVDAENGALQEGRSFQILSLPVSLTPPIDPLKPFVLQLAYDLNGDGTIQPNEIIDGAEDFPFLIPHYNADSLYLKYVSGDGTFEGFFEYTAMDDAAATSPIPGQVTFSVILPAIGIQLLGNPNPNNVLLQWQLTGDESSGMFRIERSSNGKDYLVIGTVPVAGNSYQFTDALANYNNTEAYYRVALVRPGGKELISNTWTTKLGTISGLQLAPTLVSSKLLIRLNSKAAQTASIRVLNSNGQVVMNQSAGLEKGYSNIQLTGLEKLTPGTYMVQIHANNTILQGKIVVVH